MGLFLLSCGGDKVDKNASIEERREQAKNRKTDPALVTPPENQAQPVAEFDSPLEGSNWKIYELAATDLQHTFEEENETVLTFASGLVRGMAYCNQFNANYEVPTDGSIAVTNFRNSSQPCSGRQGAVERRVMSIIKESTAYTLQAGKRLVLRKGDDSVTFLPAN